MRLTDADLARLGADSEGRRRFTVPAPRRHSLGVPRQPAELQLGGPPSSKGDPADTLKAGPDRRSGHAGNGSQGCRLSIRFTIPGPPVPKGRARAGRTRDGRPIHFTPAKTRSYEALVALAAQQAMAGAEPFAKGQALLLKVDATLPVPASWSQKKRQAALDGALLPGSRPDIDNLVKAASDGCNGILWADDSQIAWLWASKRYGAVPGLTVECAVI